MRNNKVLVVDDDDLVRDLLAQTFTRAGYTVRSVEDAEKAWEILNQEKIQVMFLDLNLPGMNGLQLCKKIRKEKPLTVLHAITGNPSLFELADCREAGFDDYFTKPVSLELLLNVAKDAFSKRERWKEGRYPLGEI